VHFINLHTSFCNYKRGSGDRVIGIITTTPDVECRHKRSGYVRCNPSFKN